MFLILVILVVLGTMQECKSVCLRQTDNFMLGVVHQPFLQRLLELILMEDGIIMCLQQILLIGGLPGLTALQFNVLLNVEHHHQYTNFLIQPMAVYHT